VYPTSIFFELRTNSHIHGSTVFRADRTQLSNFGGRSREASVFMQDIMSIPGQIEGLSGIGYAMYTLFASPIFR
jgi:hypothetical protein